MKREDIRVGVLQIEGTNCEDETAMAFRRLGVQAEIVHLKQLTHNVPEKEMERDLFDYDILMFPGGFSAGDYVRAGAIFAARMKAKLSDQLKEFVSDGRPIGGICNGFQVLVELGLLPSIGCNGVMCPEPTAVLATNDSDRFECRPTYLRHVSHRGSAFTSNIPHGEIIYSPSAHAEGKYLHEPEEIERRIKELEENDQIIFRYVAPDGSEAGYPWNPNGSPANIAAVSNLEGNVFGMMPHPERAFYVYQHPEWPRWRVIKDINPMDPGDGYRIFASVIDYVERKF